MSIQQLHIEKVNNESGKFSHYNIELVGSLTIGVYKHDNTVIKKKDNVIIQSVNCKTLRTLKAIIGFYVSGGNGMNIIDTCDLKKHYFKDMF